MLSRRGAEQALAQCGQIEVPVDHLLFNATVSRLCRSLRPVIVCPGMATQYAYPYNSDTWTRGRPAPLPRWRRHLRRSLRRGANELRLLPLQAAELFLCGARLRKVEFQEHPSQSPRKQIGDQPDGFVPPAAWSPSRSAADGRIFGTSASPGVQVAGSARQDGNACHGVCFNRAMRITTRRRHCRARGM